MTTLMEGVPIDFQFLFGKSFIHLRCSSVVTHRMGAFAILGSLFYETEDVQVREEFCGYKNQSNDSHRDLCILAPDRLTWDDLLPPLSRWAFS